MRECTDLTVGAMDFTMVSTTHTTAAADTDTVMAGILMGAAGSAGAVAAGGIGKFI